MQIVKVHREFWYSISVGTDKKSLISTWPIVSHM